MISEEEKKAIERIKEEYEINGIGTRYSEYYSDDIEIVLNLIEKQNKEIEEKETLYQKA